MAKLMGYNFEITYKHGGTNNAANALSRKGEAVELSAITLPFWIDWAELDTAVSRDISLQAICERLRKDPNNPHNGADINTGLNIGITPAFMKLPVSPIFNVYMVDLLPPWLNIYPGNSKVATTAEEHSDRNEILYQLRYNLDRTQQQMIKVANAKRRDFEFAEGDKLRYTQFFMSQLHRVTCKHPAIAKLPEDMSVGEQGYTPQDILATRMHSMNTQVLVQWEGQAKDDATWIDLADFRGQFPDSNLVGKVVPLAGSIDKDKDCNKWIVYTRKKKESQNKDGKVRHPISSEIIALAAGQNIFLQEGTLRSFLFLNSEIPDCPFISLPFCSQPFTLTEAIYPGGIKRLKPLLPQYPPYAIKYPLVRTAAELQSLLHHIHGREDGVAGHRGADPRRSMGGGVIRISSGKRLLTELINGEVHCVSRAGSEGHRSNTAIKPSKAFGF
nr:peroxidase 64 [Ipomoea batatas]